MAVHRTNAHRTSLGPGRRRPSGSRRRRPVSCPGRPSGGDGCPAGDRLREGRLREVRLLPGVAHRRHRRPSVARSRPGWPGGHRYRPRAAPAGSPTESWVCRGTRRPHWYGSRPGARRLHRLSVILLPGAPRAAVRHPRARLGRDVLPVTGRPFALRPRPDRGWAGFLNSCRPDASPSHANPPDEALAAANHPRTAPGAHDGPPGRRCRPPGGAGPTVLASTTRRGFPAAVPARTSRGPSATRRPRVLAASCSAPRRPGSLSHVHQPPAKTVPRQAKRAARPHSGATLFKHVRRRPTLPRGPPRSTIGAEGLNFRVRNGTGCFPFAITAETLLRCHRPPRGLIRPHLGNRTVDAKQEYGVEAKPLGLLVPVSCTRCRASTSGLSTQ